MHLYVKQIICRDTESPMVRRQTIITISKAASQENLDNSLWRKLQLSHTQHCPLWCKPSRGHKLRLTCLEYRCWTVRWNPAMHPFRQSFSLWSSRLLLMKITGGHGWVCVDSLLCKVRFSHGGFAFLSQLGRGVWKCPAFFAWTVFTRFLMPVRGKITCVKNSLPNL